MEKTTRIVSLAFVLLILNISNTYAVDVRFSAFGDVLYGIPIGDPADDDERTAWEAAADDPHPINWHDGFTLSGVDFVVISDMSEDFTFLGEINLQTARGESGEIEVDVERFFVDYKIRPTFNLQTGLYFTPIGYFNRFLYSRAWLMNSIQIPDLFEEELNLVPTHSVGMTAYGGFLQPSGNTINYMFSVANGRPSNPDGAVYARDTANKSKEFTWLVELIVPRFRDNRFGLSGWFDTVKAVNLSAPGASCGDVGENCADYIVLSEIGFNPYIVIQSKKWGLLAEYVYAKQKDDKGNLPEDDYTLEGYIIELSLRMNGGKSHPYIRYDATNLPTNGGPYYGIRDDITRVYIPEFNAAMVGIAYDLDVHTRLKIEYSHHFDGIREENSLTGQIAFGF